MDDHPLILNLSPVEDMAIRYFLRKAAFASGGKLDDYETQYRQVAADTERLKEIVSEYRKYRG